MNSLQVAELPKLLEKIHRYGLIVPNSSYNSDPTSIFKFLSTANHRNELVGVKVDVLLKDTLMQQTADNSLLAVKTEPAMGQSL